MNSGNNVRALIFFDTMLMCNSRFHSVFSGSIQQQLNLISGWLTNAVVSPRDRWACAPPPSGIVAIPLASQTPSPRTAPACNLQKFHARNLPEYLSKLYCPIHCKAQFHLARHDRTFSCAKTHWLDNVLRHVKWNLRQNVLKWSFVLAK